MEYLRYIALLENGIFEVFCFTIKLFAVTQHQTHIYIHTRESERLMFVLQKRAPALLDNIVQAFVMAPFFVLLEVLL